MLSEEIDRVADAMQEGTKKGLSPESAKFLLNHLRALSTRAVDLERTLKFKRTMERGAPAPITLPANVTRLSFVR